MRHSLWSQHVIWRVPFIQKAQPEDLVVNWGLSMGRTQILKGRGILATKLSPWVAFSSSKPVRKIQFS